MNIPRVLGQVAQSDKEVLVDSLLLALLCWDPALAADRDRVWG